MRKFKQWGEGLATDVWHRVRLVCDRKYRELHYVLKISRWK